MPTEYLIRLKAYLYLLNCRSFSNLRVIRRHLLEFQQFLSLDLCLLLIFLLYNTRQYYLIKGNKRFNIGKFTIVFCFVNENRRYFVLLFIA